MDLSIDFLQDNAFYAFFGIILLSYLLEDLAIVTAALLASNGTIAVSLALIAIFIGIASGDVLLYGLGYLARRGKKFRGLRYRILTAPSLRYVRRRLQNNPLINIFLIRFIPGLRSISFTLCGFFHIKFWPFLTSVMLATTLWTGVVFTAIYQLGNIEWLQNSEFKWLIGPVALLILVLFNRFSSKRIQKKR